VLKSIISDFLSVEEEEEDKLGITVCEAWRTSRMVTFMSYIIVCKSPFIWVFLELIRGYRILPIHWIKEICVWITWFLAFWRSHRVCYDLAKWVPLFVTNIFLPWIWVVLVHIRVGIYDFELSWSGDKYPGFEPVQKLSLWLLPLLFRPFPLLVAGADVSFIGCWCKPSSNSSKALRYLGEMFFIFFNWTVCFLFLLSLWGMKHSLFR